MTIRRSPITKPGMMPARNRSPTETWASTPYTTMMTEGGMIGPMMAEEAETAAANAGSKPSRRIALISTVPSPAASACATPDMPAKIRLATTLTCASPPRMWPTSAVANSKMRAAMPPELRMLPASTKSGIASSGKLSMPGRHALHDDAERQRAAREEVEQRARDQREGDRQLERDEAEGDDEEEREVHP